MPFWVVKCTIIAPEKCQKWTTWVSLDCKEKAIFMTFYFLTTFVRVKGQKRYFKGQKRHFGAHFGTFEFLKDVHENETPLFGVSVCLPTP
jgi:hypothetical protein